ncbi:hypothetical protein HDU76_007572, partial [Blyttiomyces sp. JEL0837]
LENHMDEVSFACWSSDGKRIGSISLKENVILWDAVTGQVVKQLTIKNKYVSGYAFSSDLRVLAFTKHYTVYIVDVMSEVTVMELSNRSDLISAIGFSLTGLYLATGNNFGSPLESAGWTT